MATLSTRSIAASCLDRTAPLSVKKDVFGYVYGQINRTLSLRDHLLRITGTSINLTVFLVGHEPNYGGWFNAFDTRQIQTAIDIMRELYAQVGIGVRRLYWRYIPTAEATGYWAVDGGEATDLTEEFSGPNEDSMDVFYVNLVTDAGGWSTVDGSCDKNSRGRTGAVIEVKPSTFFSGNEANRNLWAGILLAHEVAHYLGLPGGNDPTNLMGDTAVGGVDQIFLTSINISTDQGDIMRDHCFIQGL